MDKFWQIFTFPQIGKTFPQFFPQFNEFIINKNKTQKQ